MAGPLNGIGPQQQLPIATAFQPGQNSTQQVRQQNDQQPQENTVQPQGTAASETQTVETGNQNVLQTQQDAALNVSAEQSSEPQERGSLIDITV